ncbi:hypothetical protein FB451DRAFT_1557035 [Mycena latifolia]|nr:hypothetical protein FB451DRAFT_1557035 [Mycena latifolia]
MDPILTSVIQSNEPVDDAQAHHARLTLDATLTALRDLDGAISKAVLRLLKLQNERSLRSNYAAALEGVLSPLRRIPSEILGEIFLLCREDSLSSYSSILDPREAPMLLCHVSSRWRQVCHSAPRLWDRLHLDRGRRNPPLALVRPILTWSRILPLYVNLATHSPNSGIGAAEDVVDLVLQQDHRFKEFHFAVNSPDLPPCILSKRSTLMILSRLEIRISSPGVDIASVLAFFNDAPQLQDISLDAAYPATHSLVFALPWSQLTRLNLDIPIEPRDARDILAQCDIIQECGMHQMTNSGGLEPPQVVHQLNHLRQLTLATDDDFAPEFFQAFSFPNLLDLDVTGSGDISPEILPDLLERSKFGLTNLTLQFIHLGAEDLIWFLQQLPTLQTLSLQYCRVEAALFKTFTYDPEGPTPFLVLPQLRSLAVAELNRITEVDGRVIAGMADSVCAYTRGRNAAFPALVEVDLDLDGTYFDEEVEARLAAACATGFVKYTFYRLVRPV